MDGFNYSNLKNGFQFHESDSEVEYLHSPRHRDGSKQFRRTDELI